ncbi:MAG: pyruvate formate lyase family protein [Candidatus Hermodarchaeota archaeon]
MKTVVKTLLNRTAKLKENMLSSKYELCIERIRYFTEIYKKYPNDPEIIKRAKATAHTLKNMTIFIRDNELLVGNETSKNLGEKVNLDLHCYDNILAKRSTFKKLKRRKVQPFFIEESDIDELIEIVPFWNDKSLLDSRINKKLLKENLIAGEGQVDSLAPNISVQVGTTEGHLCAGYEKLLKLGYKGIIEEVEKFQSQLKMEDDGFEEKNNFYEAVKIYYQAAIDFLYRFSKLSFEMAKREKEKKREIELDTIGEMMQKFTHTTPESFYEAIQLIWFTQNIINIIYQRSVVALGRLDQILWPYYMRDIKSGKITREEALELIEELNLKLTWNVTILPNDFTLVANALGQNTQTITIGGIDSHGKDATNELSYLFLEAYKNLKVFTTDLSVRIHTSTPKEFFEEAIKVFRHTSGIAFYNDDIIVPALHNIGYKLEDARHYVIIGCVEPTGQGNSFSATGRMFINLPGVLELTLNNGYSNFSEKFDGLQTGAPKYFTTFNQFYDAFKHQLKHNIEMSVKIAEIGDREVMDYFQHPFVSATIDGCLERGKDYVCGGAKYNYSSITAYGFATLVDSIYNIKKVVYEENVLTLPEFVNILNINYGDNEVFRQTLINKYEKWGNNKTEIDTLAVELWDLFTQEVSKHKSLRGGKYSAGAYSMGIHVMEGILTNASADGRKAGRPISNSLSPVNNVEKNGITAVLNSLTKLNYNKAMNGVAVNVRFHPQNLENQEQLEKFYHLLKTYFEEGGMQIQPNVVSTETLKEAQIHPENYSDLIVKVGGYNATFVDLGLPIQNDIIDRMEHSF